MQMKAIPQGAVIRGSRTNRLLLVLMRICIMVTGLMVFFPSLNPGRISMLINENVSLFTTAISYDTLTNLMEYEIVGYAFAGIRIAVCAMILKTVVQLAKSSVKKPWQLALAVAAFVAAALFGVSTIAVVGVVVAMAVVYYFGFGKKGGQAA